MFKKSKAVTHYFKTKMSQVTFIEKPQFKIFFKDKS